MNSNLNGAVWAVQEAFLDLRELVEEVGHGRGKAECEALLAEAQRTVLMLIAAIVVSDGQYASGEQAFIELLVDSRDHPGGVVDYLNEYAAAWASASNEIPQFIRAAVDYDKRERTCIAGKMLCKIQLIGNNACVSDGDFGAGEHHIVMRYLSFLESSIDQERG